MIDLFVVRLTVFIFGFLRQNLEVKQPRFYPGQHEGDDGQQVAERTLREQLHTHTHTHRQRQTINLK